MKDATKEYIEKEKRLLTDLWSVGYLDRGMGRGSFGVLTVSNDEVLCPCSQELAEHLVGLHNSSITE
jgi:hypothetical protein